mmetsp:Transcript_33890/g.59072  ORF Transcript_33890/g.59072 Transcript_33890/m.59072 type:complete len:190 (+) Transcript_33890:968-1537(+)
MQRRYLWNIYFSKFYALMKHSVFPAVGRIIPFLDTGFRYIEGMQERLTYGEDGCCKFCKIAENSDHSDRLIFQSPEVAAFYDMKKIAACHILVVSRRHISDVLSLKPEDIELVDHMRRTGLQLLQERCPEAEYRFGFHIPPMHSIEHLHMHCIALPYYDKVGHKYSNWLWCMSPEDCMQMLRDKAAKTS